jgi:hypothetical protein
MGGGGEGREEGIGMRKYGSIRVQCHAFLA